MKSGERYQPLEWKPRQTSAHCNSYILAVDAVNSAEGLDIRTFQLKPDSGQVELQLDLEQRAVLLSRTHALL